MLPAWTFRAFTGLHIFSPFFWLFCLFKILGSQSNRMRTVELLKTKKKISEWLDNHHICCHQIQMYEYSIWTMTMTTFAVAIATVRKWLYRGRKNASKTKNLGLRLTLLATIRHSNSLIRFIIFVGILLDLSNISLTSVSHCYVLKHL